MTRAAGYFCISATIALTVFGQLILKWRVSQLGSLPDGVIPKARFLLTLFVDPLIFAGFLSAGLASVTWMAAMTRFELSHAYPLMSLSFVLVVLLSAVLLREPVGLQRLLGVVLIVAGTVVISRG